MRMVFCLSLLLLLISEDAHAMHIAEGFLPLEWTLFWYIVTIPFIVWAFTNLKDNINYDIKAKLFFVFITVFVLFVSSLKIPSIMGSTTHPTGIGLGVLLVGPFVMSISSLIVLFFHVILVGHGGITTLGANVFSMGIFAPFLAYAIHVFILSRKLLPLRINIFLTVFLCDMFTYVSSSLQLGLAYPDAITGSHLSSTYKFLSVFMVTQFPIAVVEGFIALFTVDMLLKYRRDDLGLISRLGSNSYKERGMYSLSKGLVACFVALIIIIMPYFILPESTRNVGIDDRAMGMVETLNPDYEVWFSDFISIPRSYEGIVFLIIGIVSFGFIAYYIMRRGQGKAEAKAEGRAEAKKETKRS